MTSRRSFLAAAAALPGVLLPLPSRAQARWGSVHELSGEVFLNGAPMAPNAAIQAGQTVSTGANGSVWFSVAGDAYFLRPRSELRLQSSSFRESLIDVLRLASGAIGATFLRGGPRRLVANTVTVGIRGTGIYVETGAAETYACTCFGATELRSVEGGAMMENVLVSAQNHLARRVFRDPAAGMRIVQAPFERHTNAEIARLERLVGRPNPFTT
jgi:hypothetical protein